MSPRKSGSPPPSPSRAILLTGFPQALHREMRALAIRRGVRIGQLYAEACAAFLEKAGEEQRRES